MKWLKCLLALCVLIVSQLVVAGSSYAASDHDDVISNISQLKVTYPGYSDMDITATYLEYAKGSITDGVAYNDCDSVCQGIIDDSIASGDWTVVSIYSNYPGDNYRVQGQFCDQRMTSTAFVTQYIGSSRFDNLYASSTTSSNCTYVTIGFQPVTRGGHIFVTSTTSLGITDNLLTIAGKVKNGLGVTQYSVRTFAYTGIFTQPNGYEGELPSVEPQSARYVAMGDSFSSGEGNSPFETGTNIQGTNQCHRSNQSYPRTLENDGPLSLGLTRFVACSGAKVSNVLSGSWNEPAQINALSSDTKNVTITIGGNDIKFSDFAYACVYGSCNVNSNEYLESWGIMTDVGRSDYLPSQFASLFSNMESLLWLNGDVKVYVIGYPHIITQASWANRGVGICSDFDQDEAIAAENIVSKLNDVIQTAVTDFDDSRFTYIDPLETGSPFLGHELCRGNAYFHGTEAGLSNPAYVFHPNQAGQAAYAELLKSYMG